MTPRIPLPDELSTKAFAIRDAYKLGIRRGRLRGRDLARPFHAVRSTNQSQSSVQLASGYAAKMPANAFFSHATAARLWGIPLPAHLASTTITDVAVPNRNVVLTGRGVRGHHLMIDAADVVCVDGIRLTSLARTWCDLAALLGEEDLIAAGDFLLWWRRPDEVRLTRNELRDALGRFRGRRGRPLLWSSLPFLSDRADSPPESAFRLRFARAGLPKPEVNLKLYSHTGFLAMPDLSFPAYQVAFDYEGDYHRTDPVQWEKDIARVPRLEDNGWLHLRGSKADYRDSRRLIDQLASRLRRHGWNGQPHP